MIHETLAVKLAFFFVTSQSSIGIKSHGNNVFLMGTLAYECAHQILY